MPALETRPCQVSLDGFDGPLDLLLHLVKEQQLDIATVPLASVAEQYFAYIAHMEALDVEIAAEYLVIAATLVFLKSKSLLPALPSSFLGDAEETPEQVEERLRERLIAYSKYKDVADRLRERAAEASAYHYRDAVEAAEGLQQRFRLDPERLVAAFAAALRQAKPERRTIVRERVSLAHQMDHVMRELRERGVVEFFEFCRGFDRSQLIVTFLAVLELIRQCRIAFEQPHPGAALWLRPQVHGPLHAA
ncbi:MAG: segregation/condensation protein A [Candidatus Eremiobacteraeota bacterium]|nr:segregation/condensation protein A [Candidatus Eremiobacteraeota bacterium]